MIKYFVETEGINDPIQYKHGTDSGMDVQSNEDTVLHFGKITMVHTGLHLQLPEGYEIQVRPRSGLATKGITVVNAPGTVDESYTGEICVIMTSLNIDHQENGFEIHKGDRIAQLVLSKVDRDNELIKMISLDGLVSKDGRGSNGFGSTGVK